MESAIEEGDIFLCTREIRHLAAADTEFDEHDVVRIGKALLKYAEKVFIPVEYAEQLLITVNQFMESKLESADPLAFPRSKEFCVALTTIASEYARHKVSNKEVFESSFSSHYCYEIALYMLLGLVESTSSLSEFVQVVSENQLSRLLVNLSKNIGQDCLYLTQEMALDIICRVMRYLGDRNSELFRNILSQLSLWLVRRLRRGQESILSLLTDMRPALNELNKAQNQQIFSVSFSRVDLSSVKSPSSSVPIESPGWIDICPDLLCIHIPREQWFLRISFGVISQCLKDDAKGSLQITSQDPADKVRSILKLPEDRSAYVKFSFIISDSKARSQAASRISQAQQTAQKQLQSEKISVVSSKGLAASKDSDPGQSISSISFQEAPIPDSNRLAEVKSWKRALCSGKRDSLLDAGPLVKDKVEIYEGERHLAQAAKRRRLPQPLKRVGKKKERRPEKQISPEKAPSPTPVIEPTTEESISAPEMQPLYAQEEPQSPSLVAPYAPSIPPSQRKTPQRVHQPNILPERRTGASAEKQLVREEMELQRPSPLPAVSIAHSQAKNQENIANVEDSDIEHNKSSLTSPIGKRGPRRVLGDLPRMSVANINSANIPKPAPLSLEKHAKESTALSTTMEEGFESGWPPSLSSSNDATTVVTALVNEISVLQAERLHRRRRKALMAVGNDGERQLLGFLDNWKKYCEGLSAYALSPLNAKLDETNNVIDQLIRGIATLADAEAAAENELDSSLQFLTAHVRALVSEVEILEERQTQETRERAKELENLCAHSLASARQRCRNLPETTNFPLQSLLSAYGGPW